MHKKPMLTIIAAVFLFAMFADSIVAQTGNDEPIEELRREIEELRQQIRALRDQVDALKAAAVPPAAARTEAPPPLPPPAERPSPPTSPSLARDPKVFNPAISGVFQAIGTDSVNHDRDEDGFELSEAEIGFQATVDPFARVDLFLAVNAEGEAEVEEGFATLQTLPGGLQAKGGRFKNSFGKWNRLHDHRFFTVEPPNVLTRFFGEESLTTDGVSVSWLIPGTGPVYVESISEIGSTANDVSFNGEGSDPLFLQHIGSVFDVSANATLGIGVTGTHGRAGPPESLLEAIDAAGLTGMIEPAGGLASNVFGLDVTYKWKPVQYNVYRSFTLQAEALLTKRRIEHLTSGGSLLRDTLRASGGYGYAEYQFARRWRSGMRYDATQLPDNSRARERAISAILKFTPTEFQEFRIQFKHTGRNEAAASLFGDIESDNEILIEWIPVIGTHPAHEY